MERLTPSPWFRPCGRWIAFAILSVIAGTASAAPLEVTYNPYATIDWQTTQRCRAQLHDHVKVVERIAPYDAAGYCAITWMDYSGYWIVSSGVFNGFGSPRRFPAESFGATPPALLANIEFYIPGAEELGVVEHDAQTHHTHSAFLTEYIEAEGCASCGPGGTALSPTPGVPVTHLYSSTQGLVDLVNALGGFPIYNHPSIGAAEHTTGWQGVEIFNTFMALRDENGYRGIDSRIQDARALWDDWLENRSTRIWAVAANDNFGPYVATGVGTGSGGAPQDLTPAMLDQGKVEVLVRDRSLTDFEAAFRAGAFFAIVEDSSQPVKGAYPVVKRIDVSRHSIAIATLSMTESITWIANGTTVGTGFGLDVSSLPPDTRYVRAEIDDESGRTVFLQPFSLGVPVPTGGIPLSALVIICVGCAGALALSRRQIEELNFGRARRSREALSARGSEENDRKALGLPSPNAPAPPSSCP